MGIDRPGERCYLDRAWMAGRFSYDHGAHVCREAAVGASIKDIAVAAGVSHGTVSRALAGNPLISDETRRRVLRVAAELGYRPNRVARGLKRNSTETIGLLVPNIAYPFHSLVVRELAHTARGAGYSPILFDTGGSDEEERKSLDLLLEMHVEGIVVVGERHLGKVTDHRLLQAREHGLPIVTVTRRIPDSGISSVRSDQVQIGYLATRHLIEQGHRRIAYLRLGYTESPLTGERCEGYRKALLEADLPYDDALAVAIQGDLSEGCHQAIVRILERSDPATAVFCFSDTEAVLLLQSVLRRSLRVPEDVAIVGVDDQPVASQVWPTLTTVEQPTSQLAEQAIQCVLDERGAAPGGRVITVQPRLTVRRSSVRMQAMEEDHPIAGRLC